jgi:hypothetical protein
MLKIIRNYFKNKEKLKLAKLKDEMETITGKPIKKISMEQFLKNSETFSKIIKKSGTSINDLVEKVKE